MKPLTKSIFILLVFSLTNLSCKKKSTDYNYLTEEEKSYADYNIGSYWIFQNDSTLETDSIYTHSLQLDFDYHQSDGDIDRADQIYTAVMASKNDTTFQMSIYLRAYGGFTICEYLFNYSYSTKPFWSIDIYADKDASTKKYVAQDNCISNFNSQININNQTYYNVLQVDDTSSYDSPYLDNDFTHKTLFISKDVGIVKWATHYSNNTTESWSLLRYHIVH